MNIKHVGLDLAKSVFQVHGIDEHGKTVLRRQLRRNQIHEYFSNLVPCLIGTVIKRVSTSINNTDRP